MAGLEYARFPESRVGVEHKLLRFVSRRRPPVWLAAGLATL
jgi:hypothetical protein